MAAAVHPTPIETQVDAAPRRPRSRYVAALSVLRAYFHSRSVSLEKAAHAFEVIDSGLLKVGDVQEALGVKSPNTVKKWIASGRFPGATLIQGQWRIPAVEVAAFRDAGERAAALARQPGPVATEPYDGDPFADFA